MQIQEKTHISKLRTKDIEQVLEIADTELGKFYIKKDTLLNPNVFTYVALSDNDKIIGFSCGMVQDAKLLGETLRKFSPQILRRISKYKKIGLSMSSAIRDDMKRKGFGTAMFQKKISTFKEKGVEIILMQGWQQPNSITSIDSIARRFDFKILGIENDFFLKDSINIGYHCPVCGPPPCRCSAIIYLKEM